ncbi:proton-associated sugar transporter A [Halyomorpha halys]|uniref:proton-associated sugar transporter A n=1 Tax=Halyomorpha halys TaxID=286706 RepID=UPI0006D4E2BE|nr:proton-associated sugar transporter A [Halyomorpha halys]XP_014284289.1 proton-associated sugar transporter A [Halyomorpha halys]XP_014284290.1 proton-associated sugar transporter A [Halyomorpha halys]XP_024220000.1 proton-associated sugar transporter A [Halyomorpha halys]XP_024220001.1 proton-associated sugar transporter A [Halyomorpha halys]XP_024220002.1 proton-associated sugar transporter A [Halyomorpha halys]
MEKLRDYQGTVGLFHQVRDNLKEKFSGWRESLTVLSRQKQPPKEAGEEYAHIFRKKTRFELVLISAAVMGIEFSYAAETAFVSPTLLEIGVDHARMTMVWALSPLVGFFLTPILGSLSDRCSLPLGRRRPFILMLSAGVLLGLILVPNGKIIGEKFGDKKTHPWGVLFTVVGTVLLDFDADACQSPARAYLLDVTLPEDHARGLSTFTIMAGLGGFMGYTMGGINWDITWIGEILGGHVKAVFSLVTIIFLMCIMCTVTSFKEMPLHVVCRKSSIPMQLQKSCNLEESQEEKLINEEKDSYGSVDNSKNASEILKEQKTVMKTIEEETTTGIDINPNEELKVSSPSLREYLMSIIFMPASLKILCLTNLFSWMAHVCYSLYFTDYVGEAVFGGDPKAEEGSVAHDLYKDGVRFGCYGMAMYSLSCSCYSMLIEKLIKKYRARKVYVGGLLFFGFGMLLMGASRSRIGVICFSWAAGVMYSTLFTMPYLLVAHYHSTNVFDKAGNDMGMRGLGTDVAIVSSMVFLAQFCLSLCMGSLISYAQTTTVVVIVSGCLSICGSIAASKVLYLDL